MGVHCSPQKPPDASWAAPPVAMEGGAAEAVAKAAAEPPSELRACQAEACPRTGAREASIDRRVSSALPTSRAAQPPEIIVVLVGAVA
eukprot:640173-Prymnesium_polylepis.3